MNFYYKKGKTVLSHEDFVSLVWRKAEENFTNANDNELWCNLTTEEQISYYCKEYENHIADGWQIVK